VAERELKRRGANLKPPCEKLGNREDPCMHACMHEVMQGKIPIRKGAGAQFSLHCIPPVFTSQGTLETEISVGELSWCWIHGDRRRWLGGWAADFTILYRELGSPTLPTGLRNRFTTSPSLALFSKFSHPPRVGNSGTMAHPQETW
jgi:hypothetical protein